MSEMNTRGSDISEKHKVISDWVNRYGNQLYSWAFYKTSNDAVAADLVQDTFISAFEHFANFKGSSSPKTWLFAILRNKITDHFRKVIKSNSAFSKESEREGFFEWFDHDGQWKKEFRPQPWDMTDDNLLDNTEFKDVLSICMSKLPQTWASCMQLKYLSEKETNVICKELNISTSNLWQILHRAKLQVRACLAKKWFKSN